MQKKEKLQKDLVVRVQLSLFKKFREQCNRDYQSVSQVIRDYMIQHIRKGRDE